MSSVGQNQPLYPPLSPELRDAILSAFVGFAPKGVNK